jgi:hypothetical protein
MRRLNKRQRTLFNNRFRMKIAVLIKLGSSYKRVTPLYRIQEGMLASLLYRPSRRVTRKVETLNSVIRAVVTSFNHRSISHHSEVLIDQMKTSLSLW